MLSESLHILKPLSTYSLKRLGLSWLEREKNEVTMTQDLLLPSKKKNLMNSLMYILVSLPKFIFLTFLKGREAVTPPIIFPNGNKTCSYDKNPVAGSKTHSFSWHKLLMFNSLHEREKQLKHNARCLYWQQHTRETEAFKKWWATGIRATQMLSSTHLPFGQWPC